MDNLCPSSCSGSLVISSDSDCYKINQNGWTSILVYSGFCKSMKGNIEIKDSSCLRSIETGYNSFKETTSLTLSSIF